MSFNPNGNDFFRKNLIITNHLNYIEYLGNELSKFKCIEGHYFIINSVNFHNRKSANIPLCTVCNPIGDSKSIKEKELFNFIRTIYVGEIIQSYRDGLEIDIYLPELKLGFEFNGLYWHSEEWKDKNYHQNKTNHFKEKGIRIIHIWEDDWDLKSYIVKSQIKNWIFKTDNKYFARNCQVKEIKDSKIYRKFLDDNHIQGFVKSNIKLGLYHNGELVSIMTFDQFEGRKKMDKDEWNLNRFCSKLNTSVIGGASKLLQYFINKYNPSRIISYADRDWSSGDLYNKIGFKISSVIPPNYKYIVDGKRINKQRFMKSKIKGFSNEITESQIVAEIGIKRIWNTGHIKFELLL